MTISVFSYAMFSVQCRKRVSGEATESNMNYSLIYFKQTESEGT